MQNTIKASIHIGNIIKEKLIKEERSHAWLARKLFMDPSSISKLLHHSYINTDLLLRISIILDEDFFKNYSKIYNQIKHDNESNL